MGYSTKYITPFRGVRRRLLTGEIAEKLDQGDTSFSSILVIFSDSEKCILLIIHDLIHNIIIATSKLFISIILFL